MDPSQQFGPTSIPESSQMLTQENSRDDSETLEPTPATPRCQEVWELGRWRPVRLILSVSPASRRKNAGPYIRVGKKNELTEKEKGQDRYMLLGRVVTHQRILTNTGLKGVRKESRPFKCPCSFCVSNGWDPSENARIGNYDTKPLQP
ncbi:PREDICTED: developmental pluripotency-associated protein 3 [Cercocebus atys]|uniref:developmental pluripotency-associated protein 3 n=1 Tax=Cercocebus atys TaxID=9531 RepID=UPI0005F492C0|nr:PREDICTED: developmental pluripotency-associated protein 3 [Cercocebus atys]